MTAVRSARAAPALRAVRRVPHGPLSQANFLLVSVPAGNDARTLYEQLKARDILVRYFDTPRLKDKLRISVGTHEENQTLIETLSSLM